MKPISSILSTFFCLGLAATLAPTASAGSYAGASADSHGASAWAGTTNNSLAYPYPIRSRSREIYEDDEYYYAPIRKDKKDSVLDDEYYHDDYEYYRRRDYSKSRHYHRH